MENRYFSVSVSNGNDEHIGTIHVIDNDEKSFNDKIKHALEEHFDCEVSIVEDLKLEHYIRGNIGTVEIVVNSTDEYATEIFICQTWLY